MTFAGDGSVRWQSSDDFEAGIALSPDGRYVLASRHAIPGEVQLVAVPVDGGDAVPLSSTGITVHAAGREWARVATLDLGEANAATVAWLR